VPLTDIALRNAAKGQILRENGLEFRFFEDGKAGIRFVGRVRGSNQRVAISLGRYPGLALQAARKVGDGHRRLCEECSEAWLRDCRWYGDLTDPDTKGRSARSAAPFRQWEGAGFVSSAQLNPPIVIIAQNSPKSLAELPSIETFESGMA
jgi:hypothetical protein